ncbi:hypothetical protein [Vibrio sp. AND4]|uniref:hypothetical protein n=1 Tax=Vibrio sp. AND4 TaxID=314289 RepID=UPI00015F3515|nr:hypothetical protein [Vibrio sp. AND4]EDP59653.1 hypothetical protein AND4_10864 [Vibrio sp. AND4]
MNIFLRSLTVIFAIPLVVACGGGEGSGSPSPAPEASVAPIQTTKDIVAQRDFSFDVGETITLSMDYQGSSDGALHLYTRAAFTTENGVEIGDPLSRITTVYPTRTNQIELKVNSNWTKLYAQWVPMSANEREQNLVISLDQSNHNYHLDF